MAVVDRRIERTRSQLRDAVLELIETRRRSEITVQEVTRRAGVNRATFYQHYRDKDELIEQTIEAVVDEIFEACAPVLTGIDRFQVDVPHASVAQSFLKIGERPRLFAKLFEPGGDQTFSRIFHQRSVDLSLQAMRAQCLDEPADAVPHLVRAHASTAIYLSLCSYWLERQCSDPIEELVEWYWRLTHPIWFPD